MPLVPFATTRTGKPVNVGDIVSISGTVVAITGYGATANVTVQCSGQTNGPSDPVTGAYAYQIGVPLSGVFPYPAIPTLNPPATGVYGCDVTSAQTL